MTIDDEPEWNQIGPELDMLLLRLGAGEREALLLRFFEGLRFGEMAERLRITEDGARLRVDRAVEKLRQQLAGRGITSTSAALVTVLTAHAAAPAPAGLAAAISSAALAALAGTSGTIATGSLLLMSKALLTTLAAFTVTGAAVYLMRRPSPSIVPTAAASLTIATAPSSAQQRLDTLRVAKATPSSVASASPPAALTTQPARAVDARTQVLADLGHGFFRLETLADVGSATPRAAVETFRWALDRGTFDDIAGLIQLAPEDKQRIEAILATLPPASRHDCPDAEHVLALYGARDAAVVYPTAGTVQVVSERIEPGDTGAAKAHVTLQFDQGLRDQLDQGNHEDFELLQTPAGWRITLPPTAVKHVVEWLSHSDATAKPGL